MSEPDELADVLRRHFRAAALSGEEPPQLGGEDADHLLRSIGIDPVDHHFPAQVLLGTMRSALGAGLDLDSLLAIVQAYDRALARIVDAESEVIRGILLAAPPERRGELLDVFLHATLPLTVQAFTIAHHARLHDSLREALDPDCVDEPRVPVRAIALVDVTQSTQYLSQASAEETVRFVDALHDAAHACTAGRPVHVVKFVGDGVFLVGRDPLAVAEASLDALAALGQRAVGAGAHAGLAVGPVVRRAGDYFGFAVNLCQRLAEAAPAGELLADLAASGARAGCTRPITARPRGLHSTVSCVAMRPRPRVSGEA